MAGDRLLRAVCSAFESALHTTDPAYRVELIDEYLQLDQHGSGRGFVTLMLSPESETQAAGTPPTRAPNGSVQTMLLTVRNHRVARIDLADNSRDLALLAYEWERDTAAGDVLSLGGG
jgi:hypothetical protein